MSSNPYLDVAISQAKMGRDEGGIPIGSVLVVGERIAGRGRNQRVQTGSATLHAEMHAIENGGRLSAEDYRNSFIVSTLSPCDMCSGAILLYGIPEVIVGENDTFLGPEEYLRSRGVKVTVLDNQECVDLMSDFIRRNPELWNEDIGV